MILLREDGIVVLALSGWVHTYDVTTGCTERWRAWEGGSPVPTMHLVGDRQLMVQAGTGVADWRVIACDLAQGRVVASAQSAPQGLRIEGDAAVLAAGPKAYVGWQDEQRVLVEPDWANRALRLHSLEWMGDGRSCFVWSSSVSRQVLVWSRMSGVVVYDLDLRCPVAPLDVHPGLLGVAAVEDGTVWLLNSSYPPGPLLRVDPRTWEVVQTWPATGHGLSVDSTGQHALIWEAGSPARVLDLQTGEVVRQVLLPVVTNVAPLLLADGRIVTWTDPAGGFTVLDRQEG